MVIDGTQLIREAHRRHQTAPTATAAFGRALLGSVLLGAFRKDEETVQLNFNGRGVLGQLVTVANTRGQVKGYVRNGLADPPLRPDGNIDLTPI